MEPIKNVEEIPVAERQLMDEDAQRAEKKKLALANLTTIHPAGLVSKDFVIEPIDYKEYVYNLCGEVGTTEAVFDSETKLWHLKIDNKSLFLDNPPLKTEELIFNLPDKEKVNLYVKGKLQPKTVEQLTSEIDKFLKTFIDSPEEIYYQGMNLAIWQSWLLPVLSSVFFVSFHGSFGSGKTTQGEVVTLLSRHGMIPDPKVAFIGRCMDKLKITPFIDEFDILGEKDNELYMIVRKCQRKGQLYTRMKDKGQGFESFKVFGPLYFTAHGTIEDALQSRSLVIFTAESNDQWISKLKDAREAIGPRLYTDMFIWYIANIASIYNDQESNKDAVIKLYDEAIDMKGRREQLVKATHRAWGENLINQLRGRNAEMGKVVIDILTYLKLLGETPNSICTDYINAFIRLFALKDDLKSEQLTTGIVGIIRDYLVYLYKQHSTDLNYRNSDGDFILSVQEFHEGLSNYSHNKGYYQNIETGKISGALRDLGFDNDNHKRSKVWLPEENKKETRHALIFDGKIQRKLEINITKLMPGETAVFNKYTDDLSQHNVIGGTEV